MYSVQRFLEKGLLFSDLVQFIGRLKFTKLVIFLSGFLVGMLKPNLTVHAVLGATDSRPDLQLSFGVKQFLVSLFFPT